MFSYEGSYNIQGRNSGLKTMKGAKVYWILLRSGYLNWARYVCTRAGGLEGLSWEEEHMNLCGFRYLCRYGYVQFSHTLWGIDSCEQCCDLHRFKRQNSLMHRLWKMSAAKVSPTMFYWRIYLLLNIIRIWMAKSSHIKKKWLERMVIQEKFVDVVVILPCNVLSALVFILDEENEQKFHERGRIGRM